MNKKQYIIFLFLLLSTFIGYSQTPGFNYQALILNTTEIQIPGTDIPANKIPLSLEDIQLRFTITNEAGIEYIEEHTIVTDENGMVSLIVGEGTPITSSFSQINWDGKLKYLNVELNILNNNEGFIFLDSQKILYIPHPSSGGSSQVLTVTSTTDLTPPYEEGRLVWMTSFGESGIPSLVIWDGDQWVPVNSDYDATNELGLISVEDATTRGARFPNPAIGDQVWNQLCECIEVYDGTSWVVPKAAVSDVENGLTKEEDIIQLGGELTTPTEITTSATNTLAITNLEESSATDAKMLVVEKDTGILKTQPITSIIKQDQIIIKAVDGQLQFTTPIPITSKDKIEVYRNGARIDFVAIDETTIELEPEAVCYQNDEIRIVQIH